MKASKFTVLALMMCALVACSSTDSEQKKKFSYEGAAVKVHSLEVPPDLTSPAGNDRYGIPGGNEEGVRYSDFSKGMNGNSSGDVLPETRNVRLVRNGEQRWLEVNDKAENIWPLVKAFWQENGLPLKTDNPQAGIIETEWMENRAKLRKKVGYTLPGDDFDGTYALGERDQYHTRLERSKDGKGTEITITHSGLQEVQDASQPGGYRWLTRAKDPELEATMLQLLMAKLAGGAATVVAPPTATEPAKATARLQTLADGSKNILLSEPFDKSWRKVSLAIEQAGIALEDKDRSKGIFFLKVDKNTADALQVIVRESAAGCEVTASNAKGASLPDAQKIIDTLYQQLSKL